MALIDSLDELIKQEWQGDLKNVKIEEMFA